MTERPYIETAAFLSTIDEAANPTFTHHLKEAINWLAKRLQYSHEYYRQIKRNTTRTKMESVVLMFDEEQRIRIESAVLAFLQNIHAACDAFPFALHIMMGGLGNTDEDHFKWEPKLLKKAREKYPHADELHAALDEFIADTNFKILAGLVNQAKHKYFPRIEGNFKTADDSFRLVVRNVEYFAWPNGAKTKYVEEELDVLEFAKAVHNETLMKVFQLYVHAYNAVKK
jgi:hypothetical protein